MPGEIPWGCFLRRGGVAVDESGIGSEAGMPRSRDSVQQWCAIPLQAALVSFDWLSHEIRIGSRQ